jgi:hypothetical protein
MSTERDLLAASSSLTTAQTEGLTAAADDMTLIERELKRTGVARSTYYFRRSKGMTHDEALAYQKNSRGVPPDVALKYAQAKAFALEQGLATAEDLPTVSVFGRAVVRGVPARLAICAITDRSAILEGQCIHTVEQLNHDPEALDFLLRDPTFLGGFLNVLKRLRELTPEETHAILLVLLRRLDNRPAAE